MTNLIIRDQPLPGLYVLECPHYPDSRGDFTKIFNSEALAEAGVTFSPAEVFLTKSDKDVIRGMHFQIGEAAHDKLVFCPKGRVLDVVVDVRPNSTYFNKPFVIELDETTPKALLVAKGYGHGFLALQSDSWMLYLTTSVHRPELDRGALWSSIDFTWPIDRPIISNRDRLHPRIQEIV